MAPHFTPEERETLSLLLSRGQSKAEVARRLGRSRKTIFEELRRNSVVEPYSRRRRYCAARAQQLADRRRHQRRTKKMDHPQISEQVERGLAQYWSPEQIAGRVRQCHPQEPHLHVSYTTIYTWIRRHDHPRRWRAFLRRQRARKRRRASATLCVIANRPAVIERRERLGDFEGDTIHGRGHVGALLSLVDRRSGYLLLAKVENLKSSSVNQAIVRRLKRLPRAQRCSLTFDRGSEFAAHQELTQRLDLPIYFADPHHPWQRGTNENTNGLVRQFFPKGTPSSALSREKTSYIQTLINNRPRKRLGYQTPSEVFFTPASETILS
jgi:IS30 family transposase